MPKKEKWTVIDVDVEPLKKVSKPDVEVEDARDAAKGRGESLMELFKQLVGEEKAIKVPTEYVPTDVPTFYEQLAEKLPEPRAKSEEGPGKPHQASNQLNRESIENRINTLKKSGAKVGSKEVGSEELERLESILRNAKR